MKQPKFTPPHYFLIGIKCLRKFYTLFVLTLIPILFVSCLEDAEKFEAQYEQPNDGLSIVRNWFEAHKEELKIDDSGINFRTESQELILPFFEKKPD